MFVFIGDKVKIVAVKTFAVGAKNTRKQELSIILQLMSSCEYSESPGLCPTSTYEGIMEGKLSVNSKDAQGRTPLHLACTLGQAMVCRWLLSAGADPNAKDSRGRRPADVVSPLNRQVILDLLSKHRAK